ncbi:MAG: hypothetical protein CO186_12855 [Zetaproteobacteria bacterium CG_4_9_14_3_um_filter_49_83]|nr:MAG: hypothetical protein AUJ56_07820 [Zetaproteobacteria bacterium CG1_02_49_23]PIQ32808.1 MAG: hypothetical protein COW62_06795 [Zetaproteobacteria bacterium CG17_big_fil_post_rev_8_21_14_2_50_50_13]PIV29876.1 MAG: hypothetical protein COS35_09785 [Zetaproteobacteria bacterium CG02_land_8_20_14_3_00_50_9]PIY56683.1 MAG: hypothetical protein COZ00_03025 [Zetaproteobacteria bacterium CG_4_10_14_0_8_um_filter_49_80]PJA33774.1 MAG: hypothetical protein CO186_12855 [Zetaproteobacteria bacterium
MSDHKSKQEQSAASPPPHVWHQHINLKLAALGQPTCRLEGADHSYLTIADSLLKHYARQRRLLSAYRCPADQRIQNFLNAYLAENGVNQHIELPGTTFILDRPGMAREVSLPLNGNHFHSDLVDSYRLLQGVLHNPKNDRRTTKGVFHIVAGGLPVPADKQEVPVSVFGALLKEALDPPRALLELPATSEEQNKAEAWVSLLMRPIVRPGVVGVVGVAGLLADKSLEVRMFAPGGLVSNLDFVESIFGNAGDPFLTENDAALDIEHWTGQSGCIILAPHLVKLNKKQLGLPHVEAATARQRRDGMCWQNEDELYNDGNAFKVVCRDKRGVIVTIIADNYFGYSKKEIKSQISYSANLFGGCEEEHAGGALAFPRYNLGEVYIPRASDKLDNHTFADLCQRLGDKIELNSEGYAVDKQYPEIVYLPEDACISLHDLQVSWQGSTGRKHMKLLASQIFIYPSGFRVHMARHAHSPSWRLIGTLGEGTFCHKPSTVSGGGKSEISKSIAGAVISGATYVDDFEQDLKQVRAIFERDYSNRFRHAESQVADTRTLLSKERSLGSVIKMLTPSVNDYTDDYNRWLKTIPPQILALVFMIKRFYRTAWGDNWHEHFSVDTINGKPGNELRFHGRKLVSSYLRVGFDDDGSWRLFKLRQDFIASDKLQMEDDITASIVIPVHYVSGLNGEFDHPCIKLVDNCEMKLFQRPDEAIHRGSDMQTEADLSDGNNFISNFEPLRRDDAQELMDDVMSFEQFSTPMQSLISNAAEMDESLYFVSSAHPRIVNGKPSQNVRYLQDRPDLAEPRASYLATISTHLRRGLEPEQAVYFPVNAVLTGRRNNPPEPGIRSLAVYNPIHYQELPELFMDFICSLTGKSPSTTGAGSEGALTKGPFNSLTATADLNTALVSFILCGYDGFSTAAGFIGARRRIDHDISMLIPEIWCRLPANRQKPAHMIRWGYLEKLEDFQHNGKTVLASRLGYRITKRFVRNHFGKVFDTPVAVFDKAMLKPETQDLESFVDGIHNICEAHQRVALDYFTDGSIDDACPPLRALLHIMAYGHDEGRGVDDPAIRDMFTREYLLQSDWYQERIDIKQARDTQLWLQHRENLLSHMAALDDDESDRRLHLEERINKADCMIERVSSQDYQARLQGTLGADWIHRG